MELWKPTFSITLQIPAGCPPVGPTELIKLRFMKKDYQMFFDICQGCLKVT